MTKPCKLTFEGTRYQIYAGDSVVRIATVSIGDGMESIVHFPVDESTAIRVKAEAKRLLHNRNRRERDQAMRDLGLKKTPYGWE